MPEAYLLAGATATGKSAVIHHLARQDDAAILSADSMLVYRGMDIGTAKPSADERAEVPYLGIDLATPDEPFSTGKWLEAVTASAAQTDRPIYATGGTGLYFKALTEGLDGPEASPERRHYWNTFLEQQGIDRLAEEVRRRWPEAFAALDDPLNPRRLTRAAEVLERTGHLPDAWRGKAPRPPLPALTMPREALQRRIARRVERMFEQGLVEEVKALRAAYPVWSETARKAIGYAEVCAWLDGQCTLETAKNTIITRTRQLAKRQETWFRHQADTVWIEITGEEPVEAVAERVRTIWSTYGRATLRT